MKLILATTLIALSGMASATGLTAPAHLGSTGASAFALESSYAVPALEAKSKKAHKRAAKKHRMHR